MVATISLQAVKLNQLRHIDDVMPLDASDACLQELKDVLVKHGCQYKIGLTLLHKHFDLADDEVLLEHCDEAARTLTIRPIKRTELGPHVMETAWHFDENALTGQLACEPFCPTDAKGRHQGRKDHY